MDLIVIGVNHRTAPIDVREQLVFTDDEVLKVLTKVREQQTLAEAMLLSTCNRTEFYGLSNNHSAAKKYILNFLNKEKHVDLVNHDNYSYILTKHEPVRHLLKVAAGLDSLVLGESQILGQVRRSYELSKESDACGVILNRVLQSAISVGKRVRTETDIGAGAVSVSSAAAELAGKIFADLSTQKVLLIGVGEMGTLTAKHMIERGVSFLKIANRTFSKAENLAKTLSGSPTTLDRLQETLIWADIVISCTGATQPIVTKEMMLSIMKKRSGRAIYIIDIAVPRDFDARIGELDGAFLHDIDDMKMLVDRNLDGRRTEIPKAEIIIEKELEEYTAWRRSLVAMPLIKKLREHVENIRLQEIERHGKRFCDRDREQIELLTESLVKKILHPIMGQARQWSDDEEIGTLRIDSLYEAFNLERPEVSAKKKP